MSRLLAALRCENRGPPPIWMMRQAGRYLPEYQALRAHHSLETLFHTPELAAQVTLQPITRFGFDAAILFSDILVIAESFGMTLSFPDKKGPQLSPLPDELIFRSLPEYVFETIRLVKPSLKVPLIGFAGGPYTVATYMIGKETLPSHSLLQKLTDATILYLKEQVRSGADLLQVFDSWAGLLPPDQLHALSHQYLKQIVDALRPTPVILFSRNSSLHPTLLSALHPAAISFDWHADLSTLRTLVPHPIAIQGNLNPDLLRGPTEPLRAAIESLPRHDPGYIANLGHGVLPDTPIKNVHLFIDLIRSRIDTHS